MKMFRHVAALVAILFVCALTPALAQNGLPAGGTLVQPAPSQYSLTPISATAAVNNQVTLTIPAPAAGLYNYVCYLKLLVVQDNTSTVNTSQVTTSTNFNSFALKYGLAATANLTLPIDALPPLNPAGGCYKSTAPATATTFVSPSAIANTAFAWLAGYYQAP